MGVINAHTNVKYINSKTLLSRIKRELKSFDQMGILDSNDFYQYAMDVLDLLGLAAYVEADAVVCMKKGLGVLPENFKYLDIAYLCESNDKLVSHPRLQNSYVFYTDTLYEELGTKDCGIKCVKGEDGFKITVREYIKGDERIYNYDYRIYCPLRVTTSSLEQCVQGFNNNRSPHEISISGNRIHGKFEDALIYIKYYGLPIDDDGLPMIPDNEAIQRAIRYYSIYQYLLSWYWNDTVPGGVASKAKEAERLYNIALGDCLYESKLPSFATLTDVIRRQRQRLNTYQQIDHCR